MGRPKGSKNKTLSVARARGGPRGNGGERGIGDNGPPAELNEEQRRALLLQAVDEIMPQKEKVASIVGKMRTVYQRYKANGVAKKDIDFAISLKTMEAEDASKATARYLEIMAWCHPGVQAELFPDFERSQAKVAG